MAKRNTDGSYDLGVMQINTKAWGKKLYVFFPKKALRDDACTSVFAGAYILRREMDSTGNNLWKSIGRYHSMKPKYQIPYIHKVRRMYMRIRRQFQEILLATNGN